MTVHNLSRLVPATHAGLPTGPLIHYPGGPSVVEFSDLAHRVVTRAGAQGQEPVGGHLYGDQRFKFTCEPYH